MEKRVRIVKKGEDDSNIIYWLSLTAGERMKNLREMREEVNKRLYGTGKRFERVCRIVKREEKFR